MLVPSSFFILQMKRLLKCPRPIAVSVVKPQLEHKFELLQVSVTLKAEGPHHSFVSLGGCEQRQGGPAPTPTVPMALHKLSRRWAQHIRSSSQEVPGICA